MREREKKKTKRGLKTKNALTSETQVSVCLYHGVSCHSTGLSTHTRQFTSTHTHCLLWRMIPGGHARRGEHLLKSY